MRGRSLYIFIYVSTLTIHATNLVLCGVLFGNAKPIGQLTNLLVSTSLRALNMVSQVFVINLGHCNLQRN